MITAADSNVLIDVFLGDKRFGSASAQALRQCLNEGAVVVSGVVLVEVMPLFPSSQDFMNALGVLHIEPVNIAMPSYFAAAAAWKDYRQQGGNRNRIVADFLIGAHAEMECDRLLTRDRSFYRKYFKKLAVMEPG